MHDKGVLKGDIDEELKPLPPLTKRQKECLLFIFDYFSENHYYPTHREVARQMDIKTNSAATFLDPLEKKGYIMKGPGKNRNIQLTKAAVLKLKLIESNKDGDRKGD